MSTQEQAKFTALKADVPGLYVLSSKPDSDVQMETTPEENAKVEAAQVAAGTQEKSAITNVADTDVPAPAPQPNAKPSATVEPAPVVTAKVENSGPIATFKVTTQAVEVDVVVTDAKGHPSKEFRLKIFNLWKTANLKMSGTSENLIFRLRPHHPSRRSCRPMFSATILRFQSLRLP